MPDWFTRGPRASTAETQVDTQLGAGAFNDWIDGLKPGDVVGRYIVRGVLGAGGMGVVLEAFDPMLARRVALKVMRHGPAVPSTNSQSDAAKTVGGHMLMREANGMAQISHPHVIPIFDVGWIDGRFFLAMELNVGLTMSGWLRLKPRAWPEVVRIMVQAASGLAAIHAVGLIHCDFKPANLLVDSAGHLRIADFGLAKRMDEVRRQEPRSDARPGVVSTDTAEGSRTHGHAGTLSYMAPEQHRGDPLDARCDQFAFFVTLYEALFRRMPYRASSHEEMLALIASAPDRNDFFQGQFRLPKWLIDALRRGLASASDHRFDDMNQVGEVLVQGLRASQHRPFYLSALGGAALTLAATIGAVSKAAHDPCDSIAINASAVWNDTVAQGLARHFLESSLPNAVSQWESVQSHFQERISHWSEVADQQCHAPLALNLAGQRCLDGALVGIGSATRVLLASDEQMLIDPSNVLAAIPDPQDCVAANRHLASAPPWPDDPVQQESVAKLRDKIVHLRMLGRAGNLNGIDEMYPLLLAQAQQLDYWPVWAELEFQAGLGFAQFLELEAADVHFKKARLLAQASDHNDILGWSLASEIYGYAFRNHDSENFAEQKALSRAIVQRLSDPPLLLAEWLNNVGIVEMNRGLMHTAEAKFRQSKDLAGNLRGHTYLSSAERLNNIAITLQETGRIEESRSLLLLALKDLTNSDGTLRTRAGMLLLNLARTEIYRGRYRQAERLFIEALQIGAKISGKMAGDAELACANMQWLYDQIGRHDKTLYVNRLCPENGIPFLADPGLKALWDHLLEVRALAAAGYHAAAWSQLAATDQARSERILTTPDAQPYILLLLYQTMLDAGPIERAIELHHELVTWLDHHSTGDIQLATSLDLSTNLHWLQIQQRFGPQLKAGQWGGHSRPGAPTQATIDQFARAYYALAGKVGPSHPDTLAAALAYLDVLQVADRQRDFGKFLDEVWAANELWAKEIPRRHLALVLRALDYAVACDDLARAKLYFDEYLALRDFELDDPAPIASTLGNFQAALRLVDIAQPEQGFGSIDLPRELAQAQALVAQRAHQPYSHALTDQIIEQAAKDPGITELAAFRFK